MMGTTCLGLSRLVPLLLVLLLPTFAHAFSVSGSVLWDVNRDGVITHDTHGTEVTAGPFVVYIDLDENGSLNDIAEPWVDANPDGSYTLTDVSGSSLRVSIMSPPTGQITYPAIGYWPNVDVTSDVDDIDFGFTFNITVSGYVWHDLSYDGINDPNEPPIANWTIYNDQNENQAFDAGELYTITDANGNYQFVVPAGIVRITSLQDSDHFLTNPPPPLTQYSAEERVADWPNLVFGEADIYVVIYGYVYADWAGDKLWNDVSLPDVPIANVTIFDDANFNGKLDAGESYNVTDATGNFSIVLPTHSLNFTAFLFYSDYSERLIVPTAGPDPLTPDYLPILPGNPPVYNFRAPPYPLPLVFSLQPYTILGVTFNYTLIRDNYNGVIDAGDTLLLRFNITNTRYVTARLIYVTLRPDNGLLRMLQPTATTDQGNVTVDYDYVTDDPVIRVFVPSLAPGESFLITFEAEVRVFAYYYSRNISGWLNMTGQQFFDTNYKVPSIINSDLCLTTYTDFPYTRQEEELEYEEEDRQLTQRIPGSSADAASGRELLRLLQTLRMNQPKNSKRLSAVLRRWSCLSFNTTTDAADEFVLVLNRLFYFGLLPAEGYTCPQPTSSGTPYIQLFGTSAVSGYQAKATAALREGNFNMSGYAIHYMDTYMDFYLLFVNLDDVDPCPTPST